MNYSAKEHQHRFAAWAAGRAASVKNCRFSVEQAAQVLAEAGFPRALPVPDQFDEQHRAWRSAVINAGTRMNLDLTHGVAAKLINIYLKAIYIGDLDDPKVKVMHPPIDSLLLDSLYKNNIGGLKTEWQAARKARWSKFSSDEYEAVIKAVKAQCDTLWQIEEYWQGFQ